MHGSGCTHVRKHCISCVARQQSCAECLLSQDASDVTGAAFIASIDSQSSSRSYKDGATIFREQNLNLKYNLGNSRRVSTSPYLNDSFPGKSVENLHAQNPLGPDLQNEISHSIPRDLSSLVEAC